MMDWLESSVGTSDFYAAQDGNPRRFRNVLDTKPYGLRRPKLQKLIDAAVSRQCDILIVTEATGADGRIIYANAAITRMTGYAPAEVIGGTCRIFVGPGTSRRTLSRIRRALAEGNAIKVELLAYRKDGSSYWAEVNVAPVAGDNGQARDIIWVIHDITYRKTIRSEILGLQDRLRSALAVGVDAIWDWSILDDRVLFRDRLGEASCYGLNHGMIYGEEIFSYLRLIHVGDRERVQKAVFRLIQSENELYVAKYRLRLADGSYVDVTDHQSVVRDADGAPTHLIGNITGFKSPRNMAALR